jgi:hypothetical protein
MLTIMTMQITIFAENTVLIDVVIAVPTCPSNTISLSITYLGTETKYWVSFKPRAYGSITVIISWSLIGPFEILFAFVKRSLTLICVGSEL